jgi:two-component system, NarL family, response regulator DevR
MNQKVKVFIVSENRLIRESLGRILSKRNDLEVSSSQGSSANAIEQAITSGAEVLILDSPDCLFLGNGGGKAHADSGFPVKILLVCMEEDERLFLRAVRAGVLGFIAKEASALDVGAAVRSVGRGEAVCPARLCKFLFDFVAAQAVELPNSCVKVRLGLTRREQQLIPMIGRGLTNKEIASQLNLSEQTIKNHVHRILHKVGVENRLGILGALEPRALLT